MNIRAFAFTPMVMAIGLSVGLSGCNKSNHVAQSEEPTTPQRTELKQAYSYQLVFEDVATGMPITDELQVTLTGPAVDAGLVVDANNVSVKGQTLVTKVGTLSLAANFSGTNTGFSVLVGNPQKGWPQTGLQVSKDTSMLGMQVLTTKLINAKSEAAINSNADLGIALATKSFTAGANGSISDTPITLPTTAKQAKNDEGVLENIGKATITLPAGVNALDANGNKIALSGPISASVVKFGNNSAASLSAFPGGFSPSIVSASGSVDNSSAFITGGFAQFNLSDSNGKPIKKFDKPITLTIDLPKNSKNPNTGAAVVAGTTYPIWSYDEASGQWKFETDGLISEQNPVNADNFVVSFSATHLSYWNLDFKQSTCDGKLTLNRAATDKRSLSIELVGVNGLRFSKKINGVTDKDQVFGRYPQGQKVQVIVRGEQDEIIPTSSTALNLCDGGSVDIPTPPVVKRGDLTVNVTESCPNGTNTRPSPTFISFYSNHRWLSGYAKSTTSGTAATFTFNDVVSGTSGKLYSVNPITRAVDVQDVTVTAPTTTKDVNFPNLSCQVPSGSTGASN